MAAWQKKMGPTAWGDFVHSVNHDFMVLEALSSDPKVGWPGFFSQIYGSRVGIPPQVLKWWGHNPEMTYEDA